MKQKLMSFRIWSIIFVLIALNAFFHVEHDRRVKQKQSARLIAHYEMLALHWSMLEPDMEFREVIDRLASEARDDVAGVSWSAKFIKQLQTAPIMDEFEQKALERVSKGSTEVWEESWLGVSRYVRSFRAEGVCLACHSLESRELIGSISIELEQ
jgi:hypothetical protein